ncbi:glycine betaine ABC transporter substrate-binding protein [Glycomyces sp. YM15]|uniref:glycine betaine ABC transporter substrate-binding protein n=1 Tax=Glycomyces sp. YM15 TaxID=2800446 RepID=UPI0019647A47|nr:glycine betaine ABC transporter substrate-binding protein [Glycomyces sp. YM15]
MQRRLMMKSALGIGAVSALAACSVEEEGGSDGAAEVDGGLAKGSGTVNMAVIPGWDEGVVATELWRQALTGAGYTVNVQEIAEAGLLFEALATGDVDLFLDGWLPVTHKSYMDEYGDRIEQIGTWNENAALTMAVPAYVDVNSLAELNAQADLFGGKIVGIEPSAGLTEAVLNNTIPTYGLDGLELQTSSTATMLAELDSAIAAQEPIVVTLWQPHWAYAKYELKNLEDPEGTLGDVETINTLGRTGFTEEFPDVAAALETFRLSDEQLANLENTVFTDNGGDVEGGVAAWLKDNEFSDLVA